jgi:co-chaperonin GroES (HSP10)
MTIKPLKKTVAVVRIKNKKETESGIILTGYAGADIDRARVIALGDDVTLVKVNEVVLLDWNKVRPTTIDDIPVYFLSEDDVVGVFDE